MFLKNIFVLVLWMKVALASEGVTWYTVSHTYVDYTKLVIFLFQSVKQQLASSSLDAPQKELQDFFQTDSISRASATMSKCVQAAQQDKTSKH